MLKMQSLSKFPKMALNSLRNVSKSLNKGDWCSNKGANQARAMPNNKVPMNPTWVGLIGYHEDEIEWPNALDWQNFETLNMCHQICQVGWFIIPLVRVVLPKRNPKRSKLDWFGNEQQNSRSVWFSCSRFLRTTRTSSMDVDMILNMVKYYTNKKWVIHNFN